MSGICGFENSPSIDSAISAERREKAKFRIILLWAAVRAVERLLAAAALILVFPVLLLVVTAVALLSKRSPLVAHRRVGYEGREIWIFKIRTMWNQQHRFEWPQCLVEYLSTASTVPDSKLLADPRVTSRFAALCRRFSIDEWPQLWQVLTGTLALVGPRPITSIELTKYYGPASTRLAEFRPGLIGLWQICGRDRLTYRERKRLDLFMLNNWSLRLYVRILLASIPAVLSGRNAS